MNNRPKVDAQLDWDEVEALIAYYAARMTNIAAEGKVMHPVYMPLEYCHDRIVGLMALRDQLNKAKNIGAAA